MLKSIFHVLKSTAVNMLSIVCHVCNRRYISDLLLQRYGNFFNCANILQRFLNI